MYTPSESSGIDIVVGMMWNIVDGDCGQKMSAAAGGQGTFEDISGVNCNGQRQNRSRRDCKHIKMVNECRFWGGDDSEKTNRMTGRKCDGLIVAEELVHVSFFKDFSLAYGKENED